MSEGEGPDRELVLVAEDDPTSRMVVEGFLGHMGLEPVPAHDGLQAWDILRRDDGPALALVDWEMPGLDGIELIRRVRAEMPERILYLIMLTARSGPEEVLRGLSEGADDYVTKPFDHRELAARIRVGERVVGLQRKLVAANRRLEALVRLDPLTGFYNRLALHREVRWGFSGGPAGPAAVSFIMVDLDHFKTVNDAHGHDAGDAVLREFAARVRSLMRQGDVVCRMGGEEFLLVAPVAGPGDAAAIAERLRTIVAERPFPLPDGHEVAVTCSLGTCTAPLAVAEGEFDPYIKHADRALYRAKASGRNRVVAHREGEG